MAVISLDLLARVLQSLEMRDDRRVHGDSHGACSSAEGSVERSRAEAFLQAWTSAGGGPGGTARGGRTRPVAKAV
jgi:hypothetical protein